MDESGIEYEIGSGNLFADIGRPDAAEALARSELMRRATGIIRRRRLTQARAAEILGTSQPTVSDLMRGKMSRFSLERLIAYLTALGEEVEIVVRTPRDPAPGGARLLVRNE